MILYYFPIAQNTVNKTVSDFFFRDVKCLFMNVHIIYYFSIYWSDTSLALYMTIKLNQLTVICTTRDEHFY